MAKKKATKKAAAPQPDSKTMSLRRPKEPSLAEVSSAYFDKPIHFKPLHTIGMSAEPIDSAVSDDKSPALVRLKDVAKIIEHQARQIDRFRSDVGNDDRLDATSRFMERTKVQAQTVEKIEKQINDTGKFVTEFINDMGVKMQEAWTQSGPETAMAPAEIRAHVARLEPDKRSEFVLTAIQAGDGGVVNAALSAPAYMLGIQDAEHERLRTEAHKAFCPDALAHRGQMLEALDVFTRQAKAVIGAYSINSADAAHYDRTQKAISDMQDRAAALREVS